VSNALRVPFLLVAFLLLTSRGRGALIVELIGRLAPYQLAGATG